MKAIFSALLVLISLHATFALYGIGRQWDNLACSGSPPQVTYSPATTCTARACSSIASYGISYDYLCVDEAIPSTPPAGQCYEFFYGYTDCSGGLSYIDVFTLDECLSISSTQYRYYTLVNNQMKEYICSDSACSVNCINDAGATLNNGVTCDNNGRGFNCTTA